MTEFCRVENLGILFNINKEDQENFAITCCKQQIRYTYGGKSKELKRFNKEIKKKTIK